MGGEPGEYISGTPEDVKQLRQNLINRMTLGLQGGASGVSNKDLVTPLNQNREDAVNMLRSRSGLGRYEWKSPGLAGYDYSNDPPKPPPPVPPTSGPDVNQAMKQAFGTLQGGMIGGGGKDFRKRRPILK